MDEVQAPLLPSARAVRSIAVSAQRKSARLYVHEFSVPQWHHE